MSLKQKQRVSLSLRKAAKLDKDDLLAWRNDSQVRANSFQSEIVTEEEHEQWFSKLLQDKDRLLLIGCLDNKKIGVVRYDLIGAGYYEVDINIAPDMRGQGWGAELLKQSLTWVKGKVKARIKKNNTASINAFEKAGYRLISEDKGILTFEII